MLPPKEMATSPFVPSTREEIHTWLLRFNAANDSLDAARLPTIFTKQAKVQCANVPLLEGLDAVAAHFTAIWTSLESMVHDIDSFDMIENRIYQPCHVTWHVKNDEEHEEVTVRALAILFVETEGAEKGLVYDARYYHDSSPLMSVISRVMQGGASRLGV